MDGAKSHRTARDALTFEMLGDIGRLHDSVESLKGVLPGQMEEVEAKITSLIGLLMKAGDVYQEHLEKYTNAQGEKVRIAMENDAKAIKAQFDRDSSAAIRAALTEVERTVKNTVQTEIADPVQDVLRVQQQSIWQTLALCMAFGMIGGSMVLLGANLLPDDKQEATFAELGKAVAASWDKLDNKAKATINAKRGK